MKYPISIGLFVLIFSTCTDKKKQNRFENITDEYYRVFNERKDFDEFLSFYSEDVVLEDIISGDKVVGKEDLSNFYDWGNPDFQILDTNVLIISDKIIDENKAVVKGHFTSFKWGTTQFEPMHFTTILTFDEFGKIVKQVDWINYPSTLLNYNDRKNSNDWIE